MGIRDFTTFLATKGVFNVPRSTLDPATTTVVLDGINVAIAAQLGHLDPDENAAPLSGADLPAIEARLKIFLRSLTAYTVVAVLDGETPCTKLWTTQCRRAEKRHQVHLNEQHLVSGLQRSPLFKTMVSAVFHEVLGADHVEAAPFEADKSLLRVAARYDKACILTNDSDVFVFPSTPQSICFGQMGCRTQQLSKERDPAILRASERFVRLTPDGQLSGSFIHGHRVAEKVRLPQASLPVLALLVGNDSVAPSDLESIHTVLFRRWFQKWGKSQRFRESSRGLCRNDGHCLRPDCGYKHSCPSVPAFPLSTYELGSPTQTIQPYLATAYSAIESAARRGVYASIPRKFKLALIQSLVDLLRSVGARSTPTELLAAVCEELGITRLPKRVLNSLPDYDVGASRCDVALRPETVLDILQLDPDPLRDAPQSGDLATLVDWMCSVVDPALVLCLVQTMHRGATPSERKAAAALRGVQHEALRAWLYWQRAQEAMGLPWFTTMNHALTFFVRAPTCWTTEDEEKDTNCCVVDEALRTLVRAGFPTPSYHVE